MKQELVTRNKKKFAVTVNEDLTGTVNGKPATFDVNYDAMILNDGFLDDLDGKPVYTASGLQPTALRLPTDMTKEIKEMHEAFKNDYQQHFKQQQDYVPKTVKLVGEKFVYDSPFPSQVTISKTIENLNNLVYKCEESLVKKILDLQDSEGLIEVKALIKLPEYKYYLKELKKYDKMRALHEKQKIAFEQAIEGKTAVGMASCSSCDNFVIIGTPEGKYLAKSVFYDARNQWLDTDENPYPDFCLGMTDDFYYLKVSSVDECPLCPE